MFVQIWQYRVRPDAVERFVEHYGPTGTWAKLFGRASGYRGTLLMRDLANADDFVTIDRWASSAHRDAFLEEHGAEYRALDDACAALTESETQIGSYETVGDA